MLLVSGVGLGNSENPETSAGPTAPAPLARHRAEEAGGREGGGGGAGDIDGIEQTQRNRVEMTRLVRNHGSLGVEPCPRFRAVLG